MKRFWIFIPTFSLIEWIGRHRAIAAGVLTLLGVGGVGRIADLVTPSITPQPGTYFGQSNPTGLTNIGLASASGAFSPPTTVTNSFATLFSGTVNARLGNFTLSAEEPFIQMILTDNNSPGAPKFSFQHLTGGSQGTQWWNVPGPSSFGSGPALSGTQSSYIGGGFAKGTPAGTNCVRPPTVVWAVGTNSVQLADPGFNCPLAPANLDPVNMPGSGARQGAGTAASPPQTLTTCAVINGQAQVTAHLAVAHGLTPGQAFTMQGFTPSGAPPSGYNATYTALPGTAGTTLVGTNGATSCPTSPASVDGTALSGTGAQIVFPAISLTNPYQYGETGITTHNGQHFCGILDQYGDNAPTPGFQAISAIDEKGNPLNGAPALSTVPNLGTANVTGYITSGAQAAASGTASISGSVLTIGGSAITGFAIGQTVYASTGAGTLTPGTTILSLASGTLGAAGSTYNLSQSSTVASGTVSFGVPALNVTALNPYVIDSASYSATTGFVTFTMDASSGSPGFLPGSEFTVSGMSSTGASVNVSYIAVAGTTGLTVVGNPLAGIGGAAQAFGSSPGTITTGVSPQLVSNIVPGMQVLGAGIPSFVLPFGSYGSTGAGGVGQYGLDSNQTGGQSVSINSIGAGPGSASMVVTGTPNPLLVVGSKINVPGYSSPVVITSIGTTAGAAGTYTVSNPNGTAITSSATGTLTGAIGASGSSVNLFLHARTFYQTITPSPPPAGGTVVARTQAQYGDIINLWGTSASNVPGTTRSGWGGELADIAMLYTPGGFPTQSGGAPSTTALASLCTKQQDIQDLAKADAFTVESLYRLNDVGIWGDSSNATVSGWIDGATGTANGTATLHVVSITHGSLTLASGTETAKLTASGLAGSTSPSASPPTIPLSTTAVGPGSTLTATFTGSNVSANLGSSGSPVTFSVGRWAPMTPLQSGSVTGYIDTDPTSHISTLHVTDLPTGTATAKFSASYTAATNTLTVSGTPAGTIAVNMLVTDGGLNITGQPILIKSGSGTSWVVAPNYYSDFGTPVADSQMVATFTTLVPGSYVFNSAATNPIKVVGYQGACGIAGNAVYNGGMGCYTLSGSPNANGAVGSSGVGVVPFTTTSMQDGGAVAPGPTLTIDNVRGPGIVFPIDQSTISCTAIGSCTGTGTLPLSGTYSFSGGGTPTGILVTVSDSPNGLPLAGCSPCNLGALTGTIGAGKWSGTISNIPGGGPYYVSVRAANGQSYATMPSFVEVGLPFALWGNGQMQSVTTNSGINFSTSAPNWGFVNPFSPYPTASQAWLMGPPVTGTWSPAYSVNYAGDRFGITGSTFAPQIINESMGAFEQMLTSAFGWPSTVLNMARDGVGIEPYTTGNVAQTQTVGVGNGTLTTWCSSARFCSNTDHNEALTFNAAAMTGAWFTGYAASGVLNISTFQGGALAPNMVLSGAGISGSPTLVNCLSGCTGVNSASTWALSTNLTIGSSGSPIAMRVDPAGGAPMPSFDLQYKGVTALGDDQIVKAGTFQLSVNGTSVCQDSQTFAYNETGGNCTGAGIASSFVNYQTGDYEITFTSPPANNAALTATWTSITAPGAAASQFNLQQNLDLFGDGTCDSGWISSMFCKAPGGVIGQFNTNGSDADWINQNVGSPAQAGYQFGAPGYAQEMSWFNGVKIANTMPGAKASVAYFAPATFRGEGPVAFTAPTNLRGIGPDQFYVDVTTKSTFSGTIASSVLTLSANAVGPMWEGEIVDCATVSGSCTLGPNGGTYITGLLTGSWGISGSTYSLAGSPPNLGSAQALQNAVYYSGPGPAIYAGPLYDLYAADIRSFSQTATYSPHPGTGFTGVRRATARWAAEVWGGLTNTVGAVFAPNASPPTLSRASQRACGGKPSPCFDTTNSYTAVATPTGASGNVLTFNGLAAHTRPVVMGQTVFCTGCGTGFVVTGVSNPPTQSTVALEGQIGSANNGWTVTVSGSGTLGWTSGAVTFGCATDACIDIAVQQNTSNGTYGTPWALDNCGANNINGSAANYNTGTGKCQGGGLGSLVRGFRIGTNQTMYAGTGNVFDDGIDEFGGTFHINQAFTCNIVDTNIVQCVKGRGAWAVGSTFMSYGDAIVASGRVASLMGYLGGQSFPITAGGSGYSPANATTTETLNCGAPATAGYQPKVDIVTTGGVISGVFPSSSATPNAPMGLGLPDACTVPLTGLTTSGSAATIPNIPLAPPEGVGGIATVNTDNNMMGMFIYDNSGKPGNPLNMFFTNGMGGYWEPGLPLRPFGEFQGAAIGG